MKARSFLIAMLVLVPAESFAGFISAETVLSTWAEGADPLDAGPSNNPQITWTLANGGIETTNGAGGLVSDFSLNGDVSFSVRVRPITPEFADNDLWGLVFGFQDLSNHYRFGWGAGGQRDLGVGGTGATGLYLVKESGGVGTILFNDLQHWQNDVDYDVTLFRSGDTLGFSVIQDSNSSTIASFSVDDTTFTSGNVGVWVLSQSTRFSDFQTSDTQPVPEPSAMMLFAMGLASVMIWNWRRFKVRMGY